MPRMRYPRVDKLQPYSLFVLLPFCHAASNRKRRIYPSGNPLTNLLHSGNPKANQISSKAARKCDSMLSPSTVYYLNMFIRANS